jgi:hypothetical protein
MQKPPFYRGFLWSEREDLNLRPLVSQTLLALFGKTT